MGFDQKGKSVFCVTQGDGGKWHVSEEGFEKPLATFDTQDDAEEYARDIAATKEGSTVKMRSQSAQAQPGSGSRP